MLKSVFCLSVLILILHNSLSFAASPGINLINNPESANWVPDSAVKTWMVIVPGEPADLVKYNNVSAQNVVVRIHAWWTATGKKMLSDSGSQDQVANAWCNALNSYPKNIYIEPFNELEQNYERTSSSGQLDLNTAINRANSFIDKLQSCLIKGTIISPALDPQNINFPITSEAFKRFSIISYHPYTEETAKNYNSGLLAGKQFIFTEVGTVVNGNVVYDDCELIKFFCGKGITAFWQGQSDILAYTLFAFAPAGGSWRLTNPKVTKALKADCSDTDCTTSGDVVHSLSKAWGYIPAVILPDKAVRGIPNEANPKHYEDKASKFFSNLLTTNLYQCTYKVIASKKFDPNKVGVGASTADGPGEDIYQEYDVNEIDQTHTSNQYTNAGFRNSSIHLAKSQSPDFNATGKDLNNKFLNYSDDGENTVVRYLPEKDKLYVKGTLIEDACLSLDGKHDVVATDEQLAWSCPDGPKNLFPKPGNASSCRPVTICEVGWNLNKRGKPITYETPKITPLKSLPLTGDVVANMSSQFEGGGYKTTFGKDFSPLSDNAYDILYKQMPLSPRGSINTQVKTKTGETEETKDRTLPLGSVLASRQATYALNILNSKNDQETYSSEDGSLVCSKITKSNPIKDKPTPLSLWVRILQFFGVIKKDPQTFTGEKEVTLILPGSLVENLKLDEGFLRNGLPSNSQKEANVENMAKSSTDGTLTRDPGQKDGAVRNMFDLWFKPNDWQKANSL